MRKLIMWNVITLDGYFEGNQNWDLSFHEDVWGEELKELSISQLKSADYLVFGRVTYEGMAAYWAGAKGEIAELMNSIPKLVCSRTFTSVDWNNSRLVENAALEIAQLKEEEGKDLYVFGSADLSKTFVNGNLFDEYRIGIAPVVIGSGRTLFGQGLYPKKFKLISTQPLSTGGVVLTYAK